MRESKRRAAAPHGQPVAGSETGFPENFPRIWAQIAAVPAGSIASYGEIARRAGLPRRARLVAQALRAVPDEMALPWHRILRADGRIAFLPGSAAFKRQKRLLETEGVNVSRNGKATPVRTQEGDDLDAAIWR